MPDLPPYVEAVDYLPVRALVRGTRHDAVVLGWRGDRVYLTWWTDMGKHLGRMPTADVERGCRTSGTGSVSRWQVVDAAAAGRLGPDVEIS